MPKGDLQAVYDAKRRMEGLAVKTEKRLRDAVRNIVSAHRKPVTVEADIEWRRTIQLDEFGQLFNALCDVLDELEKLPVWKWGYNAGLVIGVGSWRRGWQVVENYLGPAFGPDGFNVCIQDGNNGSLTSHKFETYADALKWANPNGGLFIQKDEKPKAT